MGRMLGVCEMNSRCPVCGQTLPKVLTNSNCSIEFTKLTSSETAGEKQRLEKAFRSDFPQNESARLQPSAILKRDFEHLRQLLSVRKRKKTSSRAGASPSRKGRGAQCCQTSPNHHRESEAKHEKLAAAREKDRLRFEADRTAADSTRNHARKLESKPANSWDEARPISSRPERSIPGDVSSGSSGQKGCRYRPTHCGRGEDGSRVVFESKNVTSCRTNSSHQAKRCQAQYDTPM